MVSRATGAAEIKKGRDKSFLAVAEKLFTILESVALSNHGELTLDHITKQNALPKSTTYRLLNSLERLGYLVQNKDSGRYSLGSRFFELANSTLPYQRLISIARPYLQSLMLTFGESVNLGVYDRGLVAHIFTIESPKPYRAAATIGNRAHLHCTSMGKAIAAYLPREELEKIFLEHGLPQRTRNTLTTITHVVEELEQIRQTGISHDNQEDVEGVECFGASIFNADGRVIASMSISGPSIRMGPQAEAMRNAVRETARRISWALGFVPPAAQGD
ncbi:MAG: IclR family transcriptional regulator [Terriglobia bacterium]